MSGLTFGDLQLLIVTGDFVLQIWRVTVAEVAWYNTDSGFLALDVPLA